MIVKRWKKKDFEKKKYEKKPLHKYANEDDNKIIHENVWQAFYTELYAMIRPQKNKSKNWHINWKKKVNVKYIWQKRN